MIRARRRRDVTWFGLDDGSAEIEVLSFGAVNIRISSHSDVAQIDTDDAVSMLRAMLREIVGPSIDDVREVWGTADLWLVRHDMATIPDLRPLPHTYEVEDARGVAIAPGSPWHNTERAALQAAYDAGVAQRGGTTP